MSRSGFRAAADLSFGGALVTLPWIGLCVVRRLTGVDTGAGFQVSYLLLAVAWLLALVGHGPAALLARCGQDRLRLPGLLLPLVLAVTALSALGLVLRPADAPAADRWLRFGKQAVQLGIMLGFLLFPLVAAAGRDRWRRLRILLAVALAGQLAYGLLQILAYGRGWRFFEVLEGFFTSNPAILSGSESLFLGNVLREIPRLRGTACEPLYLGNFLLLAIPLLLIGRPAGRAMRAIGALGLVLLILTWSRGAWLAGALAAVTALVLLVRAGGLGRWRRILLITAVVGFVLAAVTAIVWGGDALRLPVRRLVQSVDRTDWSNLTRLYSMQAGWRAFLLSPAVGVGWGQFGFHFPALVDPMGLQSQFSWPVVNSLPLKILCETGLTGLTVFVLAIILSVRAVWRATGRNPAGRWRRDETRRLQVAAAAVAVVGVWSQLLTFSQYNLPHIWVAPGLLLAALNGVEGHPTDGPDDIRTAAAGDGRTSKPAAPDEGAPGRGAG